jgi:hypothetical protein
MLIHGAVELQVSDQGLEFCNSILASIATLLGIQRCRGTSYRPSANSQVERLHATIYRCFAATVNQDKKNWTDMVPYVTFAYNTSFHSSTTNSPFYLVFLREPKLGIDLLIEQPSEALPMDLDEYAVHMAERMTKAYTIVHEQLKCAFSQAKRQYNQRVKEMHLKVGSYVWYYCPRRYRGQRPKWSLQTSGPYRVIRQVNMVNYVIQLTPKHRTFIVHVDRLWPHVGEEPTVWRKQAENGSQSRTDLPAVTRSQANDPTEVRTSDTEIHSRLCRSCRRPARLRDYVYACRH